MLAFLLALTIPVAAVALLFVRWEYHRRGKLSAFGLMLICVMLFVPNLVLHYTSTYELPSTIIDFVGVLIGSVGLGFCLISIIFFRSVPKTLCVDAGVLTTAGPYRWSRNPQYLGWFLFLLGFALNNWSLWCLAALIVIAVSLHLLVLVEEEHLHRTFGQKYVEFCRTVPRYIGS